MNVQFPKPPEYEVPDKKLQFLASEKEIYDYDNLYTFAEWFRKRLEPYKVSDEHPVLIFARSCNEQVFTVAACWFLQLPFISLSPGMTDPELEAVLARIQPAIAVTDADNRSRLRKIPNMLIEKEQISKRGQVDISGFSSGDPEKLMGYFLTSGSTGSPKIVPLKRRQILFATHASGENFKPDRNHYWLLCLPLNHTGGISIIIRCILYHAAVYRVDHFDEKQIATYLYENKLFQVASMVPTMLKRLLLIRKFRVHLDFRAILIGGESISMSMIQESLQRGIPIVSSYGMTETCGQIAANPYLKPSGIYHPKKSVGWVFKPNKAQIRDEQGNVLPKNESGILWLQGPQIFDGYLDEQYNSKKFDSEDWFNTGDYGYLNRKNQLFIETRRSDLILSGGENVNPFEVETALEELETIEEAAVLGITDPEWGQAVTAFIISSEGTEPDEEVIKSTLKRTLSSFKIPKRIIQVSSFPRTQSGKKDKRKLADLYQEELKI